MNNQNELRCEQCRETFDGSYGRTKFCSTACRVTYWKARGRDYEAFDANRDRSKRGSQVVNLSNNTPWPMIISLGCGCRIEIKGPSQFLATYCRNL